MPNNELNALVLRRFEAAQTLAGRLLLNLHVEFQRLHAGWLSSSGAAHQTRLRHYSPADWR